MKYLTLRYSYFPKAHFTCETLLFNPFFGTLNMVNHVLKPSHLFRQEYRTGKRLNCDIKSLSKLPFLLAKDDVGGNNATIRLA